MVVSVVVASRPSAVTPAPIGVLEGGIPDFTNELNIDDRLAGSAGAVDELAAADDVGSYCLSNSALRHHRWITGCPMTRLIGRSRRLGNRRLGHREWSLELDL